MPDTISDATPNATAMAPSTAAVVGDASRSRRAPVGLPVGLRPHLQVTSNIDRRRSEIVTHERPLRAWFTSGFGPPKRVSTADSERTMIGGMVIAL